MKKPGGCWCGGWRRSKGASFPTARRYLERVLWVVSTSEQKAEAHFWLSEISQTDDDKRDHLHSALGYDMAHHRARRSLAILDGRLDEGEIINPDEFEPTTPEGTVARKGERFECPTCGARMVYAPDGRSLVCEHCENRREQQAGAQPGEQDFVVGIATARGHQQARAMQSFECRACGAVYLLGPQTLSLTCAHCDATYSVIQAEVRELVPPEGIVPMAVSREGAMAAIQAWYQANKREVAEADILTLNGVYLPAWTFDLEGAIRWSGVVEYQEGQPVPVKDSYPIHYDDVFIPASLPAGKYLARLMGEFRAEDLAPFKGEYLANWLAESYQRTMADAAVDARAAVFKHAQGKQIKKSALENLQTLQFYSDDIFVTAFRLVLAPVWIGSVRVDEEEQEVLVNGKSGQVYAAKPKGWRGRLAGWLIGGVKGAWRGYSRLRDYFQDLD